MLVGALVNLVDCLVDSLKSRKDGFVKKLKLPTLLVNKYLMGNALKIPLISTKNNNIMALQKAFNSHLLRAFFCYL